MAFSIEQINTRIVDYPIHEDRIVISHAGRHDVSRFLVVELESSDGTRGYGEASTTPIWSGETAETAQWMIHFLIEPRLLGATFDHPREALDMMDTVLVANPFTKAAVDTAIWDLWAKSQGSSVAKLVCDRPPASQIPSRISIGAYSVAKTVSLATAFWNQGIRILKFKVGVEGVDDVARLKAVRDRLGGDPVFTIDANGAYGGLEEAVSAIERLLPFGLALVEQPAPRDRTILMAMIRRKVPVPILADESVFTPDELEEALDCDAFDIVSLYPGKNGGFTRSLEMANRAAEAGKKCAVGSNLETDLGQAAMATLAASLKVFPLEEIPGDLSSCFFYKASSVESPLVFQDGSLRVPQGKGFGVKPQATT